MQTGTYHAWGFRSSPFDTRSLSPNEDGKRLLVGREEELRKILRRLPQGGKWVTVEGPNGVGKTSINNVAAYVAYDQYLSLQSGPLLIPCTQPFQLESTSNLDQFRRRVYFAVAQTLIEAEKTIRALGGSLTKRKEVDRWLNSPTTKSVSASISANILGSGGGIGGGSGVSANYSAGFLETGFPQLVSEWLSEIFPDDEGGGVVCVLDNLELLKESEKARNLLEELRDDVLGQRGLRWIISGSTGIVRTLAATPRLDGYLHAPIEVSGLPETAAADVLRRRVDAFSVGPDHYLPLREQEFARLFRILHNNVRDALSAADNFCNWVADQYTDPPDNQMKEAAFEKWLLTECSSRLLACKGVVTQRAWDLFDGIIQEGGSCSPGDYALFGFRYPQGLRGQMIKLERSNLVKSVRDEDDNRRKTIFVTSSGWFVNYARHHAEPTLFPEIPVAPDDSLPDE